METARKVGECLVLCQQAETSPLEAMTPPTSYEKADQLKSIVNYLQKALEQLPENKADTTPCELLKPVQTEVPVHLGSVLGTTTVSMYEVVGSLKIPSQLLSESTEFIVKIKRSPTEKLPKQP